MLRGIDAEGTIKKVAEGKPYMFAKNNMPADLSGSRSGMKKVPIFQKAGREGGVGIGSGFTRGHGAEQGIPPCKKNQAPKVRNVLMV